MSTKFISAICKSWITDMYTQVPLYPIDLENILIAIETEEVRTWKKQSFGSYDPSEKKLSTIIHEYQESSHSYFPRSNKKVPSLLPSSWRE